MLLPSGIESLVQDQLQLDASDEHAVRISRAGSGHAGRAATSPFTQACVTRHAEHGTRDTADGTRRTQTHVLTRAHARTQTRHHRSKSRAADTWTREDEATRE